MQWNFGLGRKFVPGMQQDIRRHALNDHLTHVFRKRLRYRAIIVQQGNLTAPVAYSLLYVQMRTYRKIKIDSRMSGKITVDDGRQQRNGKRTVATYRQRATERLIQVVGIVLQVIGIRQQL